MKIQLNEIKVREIANGYLDSAEEGVVGYGGLLDIRPKYQREFVYDEKKRNAVVETIRNGFPLNVMYWVVTDQGTYEVMDGQQRTISFCQYVNGDFSVLSRRTPDGVPQPAEDAAGPDPRLHGDGLLLLRHGPGEARLVPDHQHRGGAPHRAGAAQRRLHRTVAFPRQVDLLEDECPAYLLGNKYVNGTPIRQDYLETAISWLSGGNVEQYMSAHQHDPNANELWAYFQAVIAWVKLTFTTYRSEMKGLDWGSLYDRFKDGLFDTAKLEHEIKALMMDDDVTRKKGVYQYVLTRDEKYLAIRQFTPAMRRAAYERQGGDLPRGREALRVRRDGGRPHHPVVEGWKDQRGQLPDALPRAQPPQGRDLAGGAWPWMTTNRRAVRTASRPSMTSNSTAICGRLVSTLTGSLASASSTTPP